MTGIDPPDRRIGDDMPSPILLTGGTGTLGCHVLPLLRDAGCPVRVLSRHGHEPSEGVEFVTGDLATGQGIEAAVLRGRDDRALRGQRQR